MKTITGRAFLATTFGISCLLAACSGSSNAPTINPSANAAPYTVTGTVAYGHPVASQIVQATDSAGKTCGTATTAADGSYSMNTSACAPGSAAFTVTGYTTPSGTALMAVGVPGAGVPVVSGVVNLDPLTTVIAYNAVGMVASATAPNTATQVMALLSQVSGQQYQQAQTDVLTPALLQMLQTSYGVSTSGFSANSTVFAANGAGLDAFFDAFTLTAPTATSVQLAPTTGAGVSITVTLPTAPVKTATTASTSTLVSNVSYAVGGSVSGLAGGSVTLLINGSNPFPVAANGRFVFPTAIANTYSVTVGSQPAGQVCTVGQGSGSGSTANVTNVAVICSVQVFSVSATVSGLAPGDSVTLSDNGSDTRVLTANGDFAFATPIAYLGSYAITVGAAPPNKTCSVSLPSASSIAINVHVAVVCSNITYTVAGVVSGLSGSLALLNNNADSQVLSANGAFTFGMPVVQGSSYNVTVGTQPAGQTCTISNGSNSTMSANVINVGVSCSATPSHIVYIYAPGNNVNQLYGYKVDTLASTQVNVPNSPYTTVPTSNAATAWVATDSNAKFLYAVNRNTANISAYSIDHTSGALTAVAGSPFATGASLPFSIALNPAGTLAFVPNANSNTVGVYSVDQTTGALTQVPGSPFATGGTPEKALVTPNGQFLYVVNNSSASVSGYSINPNSGGLTQLAGSPFAYTNTSDTPDGIAINPAGTILYAVNWQASINGFSIDPNSGALTAISGSPFTNWSYLGWGWQAMTFNAAGTMAFASTGNGGPVLTLSVDASTGALSEITGDSYGAPQGPAWVALDPNGLFAYVSNAYGVNLGIANVNTTTGALTDIGGSPFGLDGRSADLVVVQP